MSDAPQPVKASDVRAGNQVGQKGKSRLPWLLIILLVALPISAWRVYSHRDYWRRVVSQRTFFPKDRPVQFLRDSD